MTRAPLAAAVVGLAWLAAPARAQRVEAPHPRPPSTELVEVLARADAAFAAGGFREARASYERALAMVAEASRTLHEQVARCFAGEGDHEGESRHLELLLAGEPDDQGLKVWLAQAVLQAGHVARAREMLEQVDDSAIDHADAAFNLAALFINQNAVRDALPFLDRALRLDPEHLDAHFQRGLAYVHLGRVAEARRDLRRVIELAPESRQARTAREGLERLR